LEIAPWGVAVPQLVYEALTILIFKMLSRAGGNQKHPRTLSFITRLPINKNPEMTEAPAVKLL
jgi:hypothetical protein